MEIEEQKVFTDFVWWCKTPFGIQLPPGFCCDNTYLIQLWSFLLWPYFCSYVVLICLEVLNFCDCISLNLTPLCFPSWVNSLCFVNIYYPIFLSGFSFYSEESSCLETGILNLVAFCLWFCYLLMNFSDLGSAQLPRFCILPARVLLLLPSTGKTITLSQTLDNLLEILSCSPDLMHFITYS